MKRKLTQQQLEELTFLKDWTLTIMEFIIQKYGDIHGFFNMSCQLINEAFNQSNLRGLRMVYNDDNEMARDLRPEEIEELNQILKNKFGFDLNSVDKTRISKIKRILKRGMVRNDDEYRLLHDRVEEIYADDTRAQEVDMLNELLAGYERQKDGKNLLFLVLLVFVL